MGANRTQAIALVWFIAAFVLLAVALCSGAGILPFILGLALLGVAVALFRKVKPLEHTEG